MHLINLVEYVELKFHFEISIHFFFKGQKYLYNTLTTTIKENQTNVNKRFLDIRKKDFVQDIWLIHLFDELRDNVDLFENLNEQFLDFLQVVLRKI